MAAEARATPAERRRARSQLGWMLLFIAGFVVPAFGLGATAGAPPAVGLVAVLVPLVLIDSVLVSAGARGRGPDGVVQPWRWDQYGFWLGVRLVVLVPIPFLPTD